MKQKWNQNAYGIDLDYLRRCKESTPEQRLDWLAAAWEFVHSVKRRKVRGKFLEDLEDIKAIAERKNEPTIPWEKVFPKKA